MAQPIAKLEKPVRAFRDELGTLRADIRRRWPNAPSLDFSTSGGGEQIKRLTLLKRLLEQGVRFTGATWTNGNVANILDAVSRVQRAFGIDAVPAPEGLHFHNEGFGTGAHFTDTPPTVNIFFTAYPDYESRWTEYAIHELGHVVDHALRDRATGTLPSMQKGWLDARKTGNAATSYGASEEDEDFAETFRWLVNRRTREGGPMEPNDVYREPSASRLREMEADVARWLKNGANKREETGTRSR